MLEEEDQLNKMVVKKCQRQSCIQNDFDNSKRRLGQMPGAISYYDYETDHEYRGGLGFLDTLFGPKEVTRRVERYDYSAQEEWREKERKIKNEFTRQNTELNSQLCSLEGEISSTQQQIYELSKAVETDMVRMDRKKAIIREKINSLQEKRAHAAKEYLQRQKDKLKNSVYDYLNSTLQQTLTEIIDSEIIQIKGSLCLEVRELYVDISRRQKESLCQMLNSNRNDDGMHHESLKQDIDDVLTLKNNLEVYLCKQQAQTF